MNENAGILIFKCKKLKNPRFYLYSEDQESLILVAEKQDDHNHEWIISQDSINLNRTNEFYVGFLQKAHKNQSKSLTSSLINTYVGFINNQETIRVRKIDNSLQNFSISFLNDSDENKEFNSQNNEKDNISSFSIETLTQINQESFYSQHFEFKYNNKVCFSIKQTAKDEYILNYSNPINSFKAFCSAISIISILTK